MRTVTPCRRAATALSLHRPRPPVLARRGDPARLSDLILAIAGVGLIGALGLMAGLSAFGP